MCFTIEHFHLFIDLYLDQEDTLDFKQKLLLSLHVIEMIASYTNIFDMLTEERILGVVTLLVIAKDQKDEFLY